MFVICSLRIAGPLWRWGRYAGVLKDCGLGKKVIVQVFHLLPFAGYMFSILLCLLPVAVEQSLLLRQFFLHVDEHLDLGFIDRQRVDVSGCPLRKRGDCILCDGAEAARGIMSLTMATNLPLEMVPSPVVGCFFWGHGLLVRFFEEGFGREEI